MADADKPIAGRGQPAPDVLVVGGGVMGLWAALKAGRAGHRVLLVDRDRIGGGASGGLLGALMPHLPDRWNAKKQFQFEALVRLEDEIHALESDTGLSTGYRRCGRLIPLGKPHLADLARRQAADAVDTWATPDRRFRFDLLGSPDACGSAEWPAADAMEHGLVRETLAARISPRGLLAALAAALQALPNVEVAEGLGLAALDPAKGVALFGDGGSVPFGTCVLSAGLESFPLIQSLDPELRHPVGTGVKGQAALFRADIPDDMPILYSDGIYAVPHEGGLVAVGSTSEMSFDAPLTTDDRLDLVIERACLMAPVLRKATLVERWAGVRPKAIGRDPMAGLHPDFPRLAILTGGFKISFGVAPALADAVVAQMTNGSPSGLPSSFDPATHLEAARRI